MTCHVYALKYSSMCFLMSVQLMTRQLSKDLLLILKRMYRMSQILEISVRSQDVARHAVLDGYSRYAAYKVVGE